MALMYVSATCWQLRWNSLLTTEADHYEPGAFDVRSSRPQTIELAKLVKALASGARFEPAHILEDPGWWHCPERLFASVRANRQSCGALPSGPCGGHGRQPAAWS